MDSKGPPNPNLSQYFGATSNSPSYFDELSSRPANVKLDGRPDTALPNATMDTTTATPTSAAATAVTAMPATQQTPPAASLTDENFTGAFKFTDYLEQSLEAEDDFKVPEDVRNLWVDYNRDQTILTMPGIQTNQDLVDPIAEATLKHLGEAEVRQRKIPSADDVTQDERGLRQLIANGCFRSAVNLTGRLLTIYGQGYGRAGQPAKHSPHSMQLWFTRLALLAKLGEFELLRAEAEPFDRLERPDVFYEFYPEMYAGKQGSIACFSFRLLLAELPIYFGDAETAMHNLSEIRLTCQGAKEYLRHNGPDPGAFQLWAKRELRVLYSFVNCMIITKRYNLIDKTLKDMMLEHSELGREERRALFSAWGRIYLQIGDIFGAEQKFAEARRLRDINSSADLRDLVDKGLITVAKNDFPEAFAIFQKALQLDSGNTMILNNMGVCLLYAGKLKEAIRLFERAINLNPQKSLNESLLVNLSTLYELESNNSKTKKLSLLRLINKYKPDLGISLEICLKLQTL